MKNTNLIQLIVLSITLTGCMFPLKIVEPLEATVIDASTGLPIEGATVLRIVSDAHDFACSHAFIEKTTTNEKGLIDVSGKRAWGPWSPVPGGLPAPNHQIAIWKEGYSAFVFSQYDKDIDRFAMMCNMNKLISAAISDIPKERQYLPKDTDPYTIFNGGKIELHKLK